MPGLSLESYTAGSPLINYRELQFGAYTFPLTFQEQSRILKAKLDRQVVPYATGEYISPQSNVGSREITFVGPIGSGLVASDGSTIVTATDLEDERALFSNLQSLGKQQLWVRSDRYCNAYLESFEHRFFQDGGVFRYADWLLKFVADDPRYFSATSHSTTSGTITDAVVHAIASGANIQANNTTRAFPILKYTGACSKPYFGIVYTSGVQIAVTFSGLTMAAGDTLVLDTDPRPEHRMNAAIYTPNGGQPVNAMKYINPAADFANNYDTRFFFPFIEPPSAATAAQSVQYKSATVGSYTFNMTFQDTWL